MGVGGIQILMRKNKSGIYALIHKESDRFYVGQSNKKRITWKYLVMEEVKVPQIVDILWNFGLLEDRDFTLVGEEAHGVKMYRGDVEDLLKAQPELDFKLLRIEVPDHEDSQMDLFSIEIFFKRKK